MNASNTKRGYKDERGIVSILVVSILTITLSLIAIGFSKLADRELRQAADRELSAQAYYAAQSGLNDAVAYLAAGGSGFSGCTNWPSSPVNGNEYFTKDLSAGSDAAKYSCVSVDPSPQVLSASPLTPGKSQIIKISASGLQNLYIAWENASYPPPPSAGPSPLGTFPNLPREDNSLSTSATGLLRVGIYAVPTGDNSDTNQNLSTLSRAYYLYPNSGNGSVDSVAYGTGTYSINSGPGGTNGDFVKGNCNFNSTTRPNPVPTNTQAVTHYCNSEITGLNTVQLDSLGNPVGSSSNTYYLYLSAQYSPLNVSIQGTDSNGQPVKFDGSQAVVDVTGQGSDVIQRIQATVGLTSQFDVPAYAVQSMQTLCKAFNLPLTGLGQYGTATLDPPANADTACVAPSGTASVAGGGTPGH